MLIKLPSFQQLNIGTVIAITGVYDGPHRGKNSQETVIAEDHEGSKRRGGH